MYVKEIVKIHGLTLLIVSDRYIRLTSKFWKSLQKEMATKLCLNIVYHPKTEGQSDKIIQTLEDMLQACDLEFTDSWDDHLPLVEFWFQQQLSLKHEDA